jgi:MoxR-like ATPase
LPEAQRDRFMARISMGYPDTKAELEMLDSHGSSKPLQNMTAVATAQDVAALIEVVRKVHVSEQVRRYAVSLVAATRESPDLRLGASPRATLHLVRAAKAAAALDDRDYVVPDDVRALAAHVLPHRLLPTAEAQIARRSATAVVQRVIENTRIPAG